MGSLRPFRVAALALLTVACMAIPAHVPARATVSSSSILAGSGPVTFDFTTSFMTSLKGTIVDKNNNVISRVYLSINNQPDSKLISLSVSISNPTGTTTGLYSFDVPQSDLTVAPAGKTAISKAVPYIAVLDTKGDLGKYGSIVVDWTYVKLTTINIQEDTCNNVKASTATRLATTATATLKMTFPCEGALNMTLSGTSNLDTAYVPTNEGYTDQLIYYTSVNAIKAPSKMSTSGGKPSNMLMVSAEKRGTAATISIMQQNGWNVKKGLTSAMQLATGPLPLSGLSTGTSPLAKLDYAGSLGTVHLAFTGSLSTDTVKAKCVNPSAGKSDLTKDVSKQHADMAQVTGTADVLACGRKLPTATFGTGDFGSVTEYVPATAASLAASGLPGSYSMGGFPNITKLDPAPGSTISTTPTIKVTFASALPAGTQVMIMLTGGSGAPVAGQATVSGATATYTVDSSAPLAAGTYKIMITAHGGSGVAMYPSPTNPTAAASAVYTVS
jgi:methionine-rich copper-binding protein CopC